MMSAAEAIRTAYNDTPHPFTPNVVRYGYVQRLAYEISRSDDNTQYGVSLAEVKPGDRVERRHDLCQGFSSLEQADEYLKELKQAPFSVIAGEATV